MEFPKNSENKPVVDPEKVNKLVRQMKTSNNENLQVGLKMPAELISRCDLAAKKLGLSRSGFIKYAVSRIAEMEGIK